MKGQRPEIYTIDDINKWDGPSTHALFKIPTGNGNQVRRVKAWIPARPVSLIGGFWKHRIKIAYKVLIGEYDALDWRDRE